MNQLLTLARAEHGAGETAALARLDLDRLARSVVQEWVAPALAQGIDLGYEAAQGDCHIQGAPMLLREMLNNLIDNAMRYCTISEGGPAQYPAGADPGSQETAAERAVTVRLQRKGRDVVLEIEDTGPGVPPQERTRVFERFYRVLGTRQDGSGLGLAIVREIAAQHKAALALADARPERPWRPGALFRVTFAHAPDASAD